MSLKDAAIILVIVGIMSLVANFVGQGNGIVESVPGMIILIGISLAGIALSRWIPVKIPAVAYVVTLGCILTYPGVFCADLINTYMQKVSFIALCTPILAYAGIAIGKDIDVLKKAGWRIVVVACFVFCGTYLASAVIAQIVLKYLGQI